MRDLFLFGSMWDLELQHADLINCRMYDLCCSMQDLFWHVGGFSCGMRNLLVAACGMFLVVIHVIFIVVCGICVAA